MILSPRNAKKFKVTQKRNKQKNLESETAAREFEMGEL